MPKKGLTPACSFPGSLLMGRGTDRIDHCPGTDRTPILRQISPQKRFRLPSNVSLQAAACLFPACCLPRPDRHPLSEKLQSQASSRKSDPGLLQKKLPDRMCFRKEQHPVRLLFFGGAHTAPIPFSAVHDSFQAYAQLPSPERSGRGASSPGTSCKIPPVFQTEYMSRLRKDHGIHVIMSMVPYNPITIIKDQ